jgi:hypothetical protein
VAVVVGKQEQRTAARQAERRKAWEQAHVMRHGRRTQEVPLDGHQMAAAARRLLRGNERGTGAPSASQLCTLRCCFVWRRRRTSLSGRLVWASGCPNGELAHGAPRSLLRRPRGVLLPRLRRRRRAAAGAAAAPSRAVRRPSSRVWHLRLPGDPRTLLPLHPTRRAPARPSLPTPRARRRSLPGACVSAAPPLRASSSRPAAALGCPPAHDLSLHVHTTAVGAPSLLEHRAARCRHDHRAAARAAVLCGSSSSSALDF